MAETFISSDHEIDLGPERRVAVFAENSMETAMANLGGLIGGASFIG